MDIKVQLNLFSGTHQPVLTKLLSITKGPILEMGAGVCSTPFLHWACIDDERELVTYESNEKYYNQIKSLETANHKIILVTDYDKAFIEKSWSIAFIDHAPAGRRRVDIKRVAPYAQYVVVHDTEIKYDYAYHFKEIYPLFKYHFKYRKLTPHTSVLSNIAPFKM